MIRLDDTIDLAGGVSRQNDFGGLWDKYAIRGFAGNENSGPDILINRFSSNLGFNAQWYFMYELYVFFLNKSTGRYVKNHFYSLANIPECSMRRTCSRVISEMVRHLIVWLALFCMWGYNISHPASAMVTLNSSNNSFNASSTPS